jgi:hypothetical protein
MTLTEIALIVLAAIFATAWYRADREAEAHQAARLEAENELRQRGQRRL